MRKILLMMLLLIPLVYGIDECQREMPPDQIPCNIISTWMPSGSCSDYSITFYNESGDTVDTKTWGSYTPTCNVTFNISTVGVYNYDSDIEDGIINVKEDDNMWLLAVLIVPLALCFFFVYFSNQLEDTHNPLKWFFRLIALIMIFIVYQGAHIIIGLNDYYAALAGMFNVTLYGWIFWTIMAYFLLYIIYNIFMSFKHNKRWDYNNKWLK